MGHLNFAQVMMKMILKLYFVLHLEGHESDSLIVLLTVLKIFSGILLVAVIRKALEIGDMKPMMKVMLLSKISHQRG